MPKEDATLEAKVKAAQRVVYEIGIALDDALSALMGAETLLSRSKSCDKDETQD